MNVTVGTMSKPGNTLGVVAATCGLVGVVTTMVLWLYQQRPESSLLGQYGHEIAHGGPLREDLILLAGFLGGVAVVAAILSSIGGLTKPSAITALLLGAFALTYPVLTWLDVIGTPLRVALFPGS